MSSTRGLDKGGFQVRHKGQHKTKAGAGNNISLRPRIASGSIDLSGVRSETVIWTPSSGAAEPYFERRNLPQ